MAMTKGYVEPVLTARQERLRVLAAEMQQLEEEELAEIAAKKAAVTRVWQFTLLPSKDSYNAPRDGCGVVQYQLLGKVVNKDECLAAGQSEHEIRVGGMTYLFNTLNGRFVCSTGGGSVYISDRDYWGKGEKAEGERTYGLLEDFLREHPEGGDVTAIITSQKTFVR